MGWDFPRAARFDVVTDRFEYINCVLIQEDSEHVTVERDYVVGFGRILRLRTQFRLEDLRAIHEHAMPCDHTDVPDSLLRPHEESGQCEPSSHVRPPS